MLLALTQGTPWTICTLFLPDPDLSALQGHIPWALFKTFQQIAHIRLIMLQSSVADPDPKPDVFDLLDPDPDPSIIKQK